MTTFLSKNKKQLVTDKKELSCPYCKQEGFIQLHPAHLKTHGKTVSDVRKEFPDSPTMTTERYNIQLNISSSGGEGTKSKVNKGETKIVKCYHDNMNDCSHKTKKVSINSPNNFLCDTCKILGRKSLDGRFNDEANQKRMKTNYKKYSLANVILRSLEYPEEVKKYQIRLFEKNKHWIFREDPEIIRNDYFEENLKEYKKLGGLDDIEIYRKNLAVFYKITIRLYVHGDSSKTEDEKDGMWKGTEVWDCWCGYLNGDNHNASLYYQSVDNIHDYA